MARYYVEARGGRVTEVIAQDESGVYSGALFDAGGKDPEVRTVVYYDKHRLHIKLPEWASAREVSTTSVEYLDFVRRCERGSYSSTAASDIKEIDGSAEEVIRQVLKDAGDLVIVEGPLPRSR